MRDKKEIKMLGRFLDKFEQVPIDEDASYCALELVRNFAKSHTLDIPDSLTAASALTNQATFIYVQHQRLSIHTRHRAA